MTALLEALGWSLPRTKGTIISAGAGPHTGLVHGYAEATGRHVVTMDSDPAWLEGFTDYREPFHEVRHDIGNIIPLGEFDLMVVTYGEPLLRAWWAKLGLDQGATVIVTDTEPETVDDYEGLRGVLMGAKQRRDFTRTVPHATAVWN